MCATTHSVWVFASALPRVPTRIESTSRTSQNSSFLQLSGLPVLGNVLEFTRFQTGADYAERSALETTAQKTFSAPARRRTPEQALSVEPVVQTSSIKSILFPRTRARI